MKSNTRELAPQWTSGKNLGDYTITTSELEPADIVRLVQDSKVASFVAGLVNSQLHISKCGPMVAGKVKATLKRSLEAKLSEGQSLPKASDWQTAGHAMAVGICQELMKNQVFNFEEMLVEGAEKAAEKGKGTKLSPLEALVKALCDAREAAGKPRNEEAMRAKATIILLAAEEDEAESEDEDEDEEEE